MKGRARQLRPTLTRAKHAALTWKNAPTGLSGLTFVDATCRQERQNSLQMSWLSRGAHRQVFFVCLFRSFSLFLSLDFECSRCHGYKYTPGVLVCAPGSWHLDHICTCKHDTNILLTACLTPMSACHVRLCGNSGNVKPLLVLTITNYY